LLGFSAAFVILDIHDCSPLNQQLLQN